MKKLVVVLFAIALTACSTTKVAEDSASKEATKFTQDFGKVEVTYSNDTWELIRATATAAIPITDEAGLEQAMNIATLRASRNIIEFMQQDLKNQRTVDIMTTSLAKEVADNDNKSKQKAADIATKIVEKMTQDSNGIIKGAYVIDRKVSGDTKMVTVTMQVDKRSVRTANQLRSSMGM